MKAAFFACKAVGLDPSVRNIVRATAAIRGLVGKAKPVWGEHARTWLQQNDTLAIQPRHGNDTPGLLKTAQNDTPAIQARHPRARVVKELVLQTSLSPIGDTAGSARPEPEWVKALRREIKTIDGLTISALTVGQRVALGRYHAYRFEKFTVSEVKNKNRGLKHVGPLAELGKSKYGDVTVADYRAYMQGLLVTSGALIRSVWDLRGAIEDEA